MSSQGSPITGLDQYALRPSINFPPPPPRPSDASRRDSLRRTNVARPPSLTTNIPSSQAGQHLLTPNSTTSLSSPFAQNNPAYTPSPGSASRGGSPMASRSSVYNVPYNPSQWAPGTRAASQAEVQDRTGAHAEDGLSAPPPPYSPPTSRESRDSTGRVGDARSIRPAERVNSGNTSQGNTPTSTPGVISPLSQPATNSRDSASFPANTPSSVPILHTIPPPPARNSGVDSRHAALLNRTRPMSVSALSQVMNMSSQFGHRSESQAETQNLDEAIVPPAAKRAASTGAVSTGNSSAQSRDHSGSRSSSTQRGWQPGMPLPGPPPGPPPAASRSQSASATPDASSKTLNTSTARSQAHRVPLRPPMLSPMPPTPAGWTEDQPLRSATRPVIPLHIQTTNLGGKSVVTSRSSGHTSDSHAGPSSSGSNLMRSAAVRDSSAKGIRERRNLRKSLHERDFAGLSALTVNTNPWADAMTSAASTNRSPGGFSEFTNHDDSLVTSPAFERPLKSRSLSRATLTDREIVSSPFPKDIRSPRSPTMRFMSAKAKDDTVKQLPPKALPTPPLSQKAPASANSIRHASTSSLNRFEIEDAEEFVAESLRRHQNFLSEERKASTDTDRLRIFTDYMVAESALRRKRYASVFATGGIDLAQVRESLFAESSPAGELSSDPQTPAEGLHTPASSDITSRPETMWWKEYHPALSPIASMSNDELSSRGRTSSRWWESQAGSHDDAGARKVRRSKRESKYMGLSTALMQQSITEANTPTNLEYAQNLKDDEYPEEKQNPESFGMYDEDYSRSQDDYPNQQKTPGQLDISRFITLPPPYPRHYPAVNNSHPDLTVYRNTVRGLSDMSEIRARKSRHTVSAEALRTGHEQKLAEARQTFKNNVQVQIDDGMLTYAEAAEAERVLRSDEQQAEKECLQAEFDTLQDVVIKPLHEMLNDRLVQLSASIGELTEKLFIDAQDQNPDRAQQEGDDTPELLEYLTQLKWLFETREQVHKEIFDLLTERNDKYRAIVILPYRQANNPDKVRDTEEFFRQDATDRREAFCKESLARHEQFFNIIEDSVARGIQMQSSAFWDIAPGLVTLLQSIPSEMRALDSVAIPEQEYLENPSYYRFPQQYVYTLLDHAEKSTYQFIESQINLHCIMHEVKNSLLLARCRSMESQRKGNGKSTDDQSSSTSEYRSREELLLTAELKQKVSIIEEQWLESLGSQLQGTRDRVRAYLEERGGWEDMERGEE